MTKDFDKYDCYGLDIDQTMIDGHFPSTLLQRWIRANHTNKELHVITFRTDLWFDRVWEDLGKEGLLKTHFKSLSGLDPKLGKKVTLRTDVLDHLKAKRAPKAQRMLIYNNTTMEELDKYYEEFTHWKGLRCAELGCQVLVDDMTDMVLPGCTHHSIDLYHPNEMLTLLNHHKLEDERF